ncbi:MAG: TetR family transcriptional regulator [Bacillaceae bacterium G1]|nr:TetR family transcriptional regulator [Bacillota bacterium]OJF17809.1 MAG: TetR family transcriptional regulator [Bacillaceae bacterium G1]
MSSSKRDAILNAALILFAERGYDGTTVPMIAEKAKVGAGTIYRYFESKQILVNTLYRQCLAQFADTLREGAPPPDATVREQFRHVFHRMVHFARKSIHALIFIDAHTGGHYLDEESRQLFHQFLGSLKEVLEKGKRLGIIAPLPSEALIAIVFGAFVRTYKVIRSGELEDTPALMEQVEMCCWNAIRC